MRYGTECSKCTTLKSFPRELLHRSIAATATATAGLAYLHVHQLTTTCERGLRPNEPGRPTCRLDLHESPAVELDEGAPSVLQRFLGVAHVLKGHHVRELDAHR